MENEVIKPKRKYTRRKKEEIKKEIIDTNPTDEDYVKYCGSNGLTFLSKFKNLEKNGLEFNFCAAFLGLPYLLYRKLYLLALIYILLTALLPMNFILMLGLALILGIGTDYAYYKKAKSCIKSIKENEGLSSEMKEELIRQTGGVDTASAMIIVIVQVFAALLLINLFHIALFTL